jgi:hypothetical protein
MRQPGNGRITILFNAFEGPPRILRLWGKGAHIIIPISNSPKSHSHRHITGTVYEFGTPEYNDFIPPSNRKAGSRAIIVIDVHKVGTVRSSGSSTHKLNFFFAVLRLWRSVVQI